MLNGQQMSRFVVQPGNNLHLLRNIWSLVWFGLVWFGLHKEWGSGMGRAGTGRSKDDWLGPQELPGGLVIINKLVNAFQG